MLYRRILHKCNLLFKNMSGLCNETVKPETTNAADEIKVAVCQMTSTNNKAKNLEVVTRLIEQARDMNAKMVFFPEACDFICSNTEEYLTLAEPLTGSLMKEYKNLAQKNKIWVSIGGFHELPSNGVKSKTYNTSCIINDEGEIVQTYRKLHLFNVCIPEFNIKLIESDINFPGDSVCPPVKTPVGNIGMGICYDLRFPEFSTILRKLGANILLYPSAFTHKTGEAHWEVLLRARAIENQCYVIAAAQAGRHNEKRISYGQAMIVDPWGNIKAELPKYNKDYCDDGLIALASIKNETVDSVRKQMPVFEHRRYDCYNLTVKNYGCSYNNPLGVPNTTEPFLFADKVIPRETVFYETAHSFAFTNLRCVVPGHVLIASKRKALKLTDLDVEEQADFFQASVKVERLMESVHKTSSSSVVCQDGVDAGQTVPHVHIHILPRMPNDFVRNDEVYDVLAKHDRDDTKIPARPLEEMISEANMLRKLINNM